MAPGESIILATAFDKDAVLYGLEECENNKLCVRGHHYKRKIRHVKFMGEKKLKGSGIFESNGVKGVTSDLQDDTDGCTRGVGMLMEDMV